MGSRAMKVAMVQELKQQTPPALWEKLKPIAREMRHEPTAAEEQLWRRLRNRQTEGMKFRRQHSLDKFIVDFYCSDAKLVIEVDGSIHEYTVEEDAVRQEFLESLGLRVLRFTNDQVINSLESVIECIAGCGSNTSRATVISPSPQGVEGARG